MLVYAVGKCWRAREFGGAGILDGDGSVVGVTCLRMPGRVEGRGMSIGRFFECLRILYISGDVEI